jgi:tRNA(fMet)-specific endonuclease VapC
VKYLIDTDRVADYLKRRPDAVTLLEGLLHDGIAISIITYGELYEGVYFGHDPQRHEGVLRRFLRGVDVLGVSRPIARRFAQISGTLRARGEPILPSDIFIAATAIHHDLILVTRNVRHFGRITGLKLL